MKDPIYFTGVNDLEHVVEQEDIRGVRERARGGAADILVAGQWLQTGFNFADLARILDLDWEDPGEQE